MEIPSKKSGAHFFMVFSKLLCINLDPDVEIFGTIFWQYCVTRAFSHKRLKLPFYDTQLLFTRPVMMRGIESSIEISASDT